MTVAVLVLSPSRSLVFEANSRNVCAPIFRNSLASSISLVTATLSLGIRGCQTPFRAQCYGPSDQRSSAAAKREARGRPEEGTERHRRRSCREPIPAAAGRRKAGVVGRT